MTYLQDFIHALKGVAAPVALILFGAIALNSGVGPIGAGAGLTALALFLSGIAWVVYLSFFSRD